MLFITALAVGCSDSDGGSGSGTASLCTTFCNRMNDCGTLGSTTIADCQSSCNSQAPQCTPTASAYAACDNALKTQDCSTLASSTPTECVNVCQGSNGGNGGSGNGGSGGSGNGGSGNGGTSNTGDGCATYCAKYVECGFLPPSSEAECVSSCQGTQPPAGCDFDSCASAVGAQSCAEVTGGTVPPACASCYSEG